MTKKTFREGTLKSQVVAVGEVIVEIRDTPVILVNDLATFYETKN